jgi:serine/threonine-protein kinase
MVIDQYEIIGLLAEGPVADVYQGRQQAIDRLVAVKAYIKGLLRGRELDDFRQDAGVIARLEHINIVPLYAFGEHKNIPYMVLRFYGGGALTHLLQRIGALPPGNVARIVQQIGNALAYAHGNGLTHRNLKDSNILFDSTGTAYLSDFTFGTINQVLGKRGRSFVSNPAWVAPEQAAGAPPAPTMDVYSLGALAYQMLAGRLPYWAEDPEDLIEMHRAAPVPILMDANPSLPAFIDDVVGQTMAKQPEYRYQSPLDFANALRQATDRAQVAQVTPFETLASMPAPEAERTLPMSPQEAAATIPSGGYASQAAAPTAVGVSSEVAPDARRGFPLALLGVIVAVLLIGSIVGGFFLASRSGGAGSQAQPTAPVAVVPPTDVSEPTAIPTPVPVAPVEEEVSIAVDEPTPTPEPDLAPEIDSYGVPMVLVPAGSFMMGHEDMPDQRPVHEVYLDAFYIDKYEVTNAEFRACIEDDVCEPHDETTGPGTFGYFSLVIPPDQHVFANHPVIYMSWQEAVDYCAWREARLPTEAEWEKAARWDPQSGETFLYPWGNGFPNPGLSNYIDSVYGGPVEVDDDRSFNDISPVGAYHMAGNVTEWVADWYNADYYDISPAENPTGPETGQYKVQRGANFHVTTGGVIPTTRWFVNPLNTAVEYGFRCARTP